MGTSTKTPTVVAKTAPDPVPNNDTVTATASSKKFEAAIIDAGAAIENGNLSINPIEYANAQLKKV